MVTKAAEYKAKRGYSASRHRYLEKAVANRIKRAHGKFMHNNGVDPKLFAKDIWA